ncbi:asparagine synthase-related protein [Lacihabitans lacunae]|uniref:asparagine synthase (glutamine-hydrolyzing) n=1 Tax=Lacihabitans lacunae TaxID=1028214 RepID=A0ABV7Z4P1_9BACT
MIKVYFDNFEEEEKTWVANNSQDNIATVINDLDIKSFKLFDQSLEHGYSSFSAAKVYNREKLIMAKRDIFGSVPLFISWKKNHSCAISENLSSLLEQQSFTINKERISLYLNNDDLDLLSKSHITFFEDIYQVPSGSVVTITYNKLHIEFIQYKSATQKGNLLKEMCKSVINLTHDKEKVAFQVSGGLDSTSLAAIQASIKHKNVDTHYCVTKTPFKSTSERLFQKSFTKKYKQKISSYSTNANIKNLTEEYCKIAISPPFLFNTITLFEDTLKSLKEKKINYLVSGHGGDQVLGHGFEYIQNLKKNRAYNKIFSFVSLLSKMDLLKNNFENWTSYSVKKKFNLTLQAFVYPVNSVLKKDIIFQYIYAGGNLFYIFTSGVNLILKRWFKNVKTPVIQTSESKRNPDIILSEKNKNRADIQKATFSNINETFFNLAKLYDVNFLFPFLDTKVYAASCAYTLQEKFGDGRGRNHLRIELKAVLPELVRKRIGKASFDEYFVNEIESYMIQLGEIEENHLIWEFVDKKRFYIVAKLLMNKNKTYFHKKNAAHVIHRILNIKVWLDFINKLKEA